MHACLYPWHYTATLESDLSAVALLILIPDCQCILTPLEFLRGLGLYLVYALVVAAVVPCPLVVLGCHWSLYSVLSRWSVERPFAQWLNQKWSSVRAGIRVLQIGIKLFAFSLVP